MILIVEDDVSIIRILKGMLDSSEIKDYKIAKNFQETKDLLENEKFKLVITDFVFPGGDGDQVLELARSKGIEKVYLNSSWPGMSNKLGEYTEVLKKDDIDSFLAITNPSYQTNLTEEIT